MNRRDRKKEETRANIIDCTKELFKEKGFANTSMEEIAEKADVSKGTLYNYFPDKESILVGYFQLIIKSYEEQLKEKDNQVKELRTRIFDLLNFINEIFGNDKELAPIYFRYRIQNFFNNDPFDNQNRSGLEKLVLEIIGQGQKNKEIRSDIPTLIIARNLQFLVICTFITSYYSKEPFSLDKVKNQIIEIFLNGVKAY